MEKTIEEIEAECSELTGETTFEELAETHKKIIDTMTDLMLENRKLKGENWKLEKELERFTESEIVFCPKCRRKLQSEHNS